MTWLRDILRSGLLTSRSRTQNRTSSSNLQVSRLSRVCKMEFCELGTHPGFSAVFWAAIRARAVPHEPEPITQTFSSLSAVPSISSNFARNGAMAGDEPRRGRGALSDVLRLSNVSPSELVDADSDGRRSLAGPSVTEPSSDGAAPAPTLWLLIVRLFRLRISGDGGRDEPGVDSPDGDGAREPGNEAMPVKASSGEVGAVEGGVPAGVFAAELGIDGTSPCCDWVEDVEMSEGRSMFGCRCRYVVW